MKQNWKLGKPVQNQAKEEQYRRKWCIEQATNLEETRAENLLDLADKIYSYVFGGSE